MTARQKVYFIEDTSSRSIKIGVAVDPEARLRQLQTGSANRLRLLGVLMQSPSRGTTERQLHRRFAPHRIDGEWFRSVIHEEVARLLNA